METTTTGTDTTGTDTTGTDTTGPTPLALRLAAGGGLLLLAACLAATFMITLADAIQGDGRGGVFITAGFWTLLAGAVVGLAALIVPRRGLVIAQYCLAIGGPFLALMD
ncbi:hypothetical protein ASC82_23740 [Streptomyces sp. Root431]|uniref:hypothetical protein n=1 Tax=Streptomyces sp. Root431 TaxID=1736535 RepID=UPI0006FB85FD|nr:hypothetical protein [Streptomyces sp. Root431]KQX10670.1 hypothetical protein ASC82_23740 [Streptomyces sp. Root431]